MAALDFPDDPYAGQVFDRWMYDGTKWVLGGAVTPVPDVVRSWGARKESGSQAYGNGADIMQIVVPMEPYRRYQIIMQAECLESTYTGGRNVGIALHMTDLFSYGNSIFASVQGVTIPNTTVMTHWYDRGSTPKDQAIVMRAYNSAGGSVWVTGGTYGGGPRILVVDVGPTQ